MKRLETQSGSTIQKELYTNITNYLCLSCVESTNNFLRQTNNNNLFGSSVFLLSAVFNVGWWCCLMMKKLHPKVKCYIFKMPFIKCTDSRQKNAAVHGTSNTFLRRLVKCQHTSQQFIMIFSLALLASVLLSFVAVQSKRTIFTKKATKR